MASCIPLEKEEAQVVGQCGQALCTAVHIKFRCTVKLHGMNATSSNAAKKSKVTPEQRYSIRLPKGLKLSVWKDDLTTHEVDAVVNAANEDLRHIGGLAFALANAGGPVIQQESDKIRKSRGKVFTGKAVVTSAGKLPSKKIIHAVGPEVKVNASPKEIQHASKYLSEAIDNILKIVEKENLQSVAIPALSSGIFNFPLDHCANIIVNTVKKYDGYGKNKLLDVRLVNHDERTVSEMVRACKEILDPPKASYSGAGRSSDISPVELGKVTLHISKGRIEKQKTHIIVNSTSTDLMLCSGAVTNAILTEAGQKLQEEISKYRLTCKSGDVLKTEGYNLGSLFVYHVLCVQKGAPGSRTAEQILSGVISACLRMAEADGCTSIAFPAIGCGVLNFRKSEVADIMTEAVKQFSRSYMGSRMDVHFVIFPLEEDTFQAFAKKHASLQQSKPSASTSHVGNYEYLMYEETDSIHTPSIEIRADFPEALRAAKRWINDVVNILRDKEAVYSIKNNFVLHFGQREHKELLSIQDNFQVGFQVFFTDGQAGINIMGTPSGVSAAVLEVEAMCCKVQEAHVLAEEAAMLYPLVRWRCKDCPQLENPEINAALEKAYLAGTGECKIDDISVDFGSMVVKTKHAPVKCKIERICFFKNYQVTPWPGIKSYFDRKVKDFAGPHREFQDAGLHALRMETVENYALMQHFELSRKRISDKPRPLYQRVSAQFCQLVSWVGFQREYAPPDEQAFGEGIYFTASVKSAMKLWKGTKEEEYVYIIKADVLTGSNTSGSPDFIVPPSLSSDPLIRYDSVSGGIDTFVIFNGHQALPLYIYTCKKTSSAHK
ncbi:protein mono-ADP-ribosyltransferase PARP9 [Alosa sapidissima]|uniref:protein mono-ADP-ribosyltransferase PARP9 n=1 Tax=Alosa sapidissima TaxID=34773 RepID=UPI001C09280D|nr:protein mono-ADP-ribosyltransferase PARP9 [Alosa sapidissima]